MSQTKSNRDKKKQLGQFMTPESLATKLLSVRNYKITDKILEPSFGKGGFLFPIIDKLIDVYPKNYSLDQKLDLIFQNNIYGVEMDTELYEFTLKEISNRYQYDVKSHNLTNSDFFLVNYDIKFSYIEGNPPFGGTFETNFGEKLDKIYGYRNKMKIKKETYSFFTVKCLELLDFNGEIGFICSNTFLSISTMKGLRYFLMKNSLNISKINEFSDETDYGMVYFNVKNNGISEIIVDNKEVNLGAILKTENYSFIISTENEKYFSGVTLKKFITCSSGMTVGKNELFLKQVEENYLIEKYNYEVIEEPKSFDKELSRSKFNVLSQNKINEITEGKLEKVIKITNLETPKIINIPNKDYFPYNKSSKDEVYSKPTTYIFWKNNGEAVKTFKKTGPWYLHGVGGEKFFCKEGITWRLISDDIRIRYLPPGYILDSGAPVAVLKDNVNHEELFFIMGWLLTTTATKILKSTINHTKNIQSKDIERLPYPSWVDNRNKKNIIDFVKKLVEDKKNDLDLPINYKKTLDVFFSKNI